MMKDASQPLEPQHTSYLLEFWGIMIPDLQPNSFAAFSNLDFLVYLSFSPLLFDSLLFTAIHKASADSHFAFLHLFFLGMVLIPVSYTMS